MLTRIKNFWEEPPLMPLLAAVLFSLIVRQARIVEAPEHETE